MKNFIQTACLFLIFSCSMFAQNTDINPEKKVRKNEIGISINTAQNLSDSWAIIYRRQISENTYLRASGAATIGFMYKAGKASIGIEKRKYLSDNFYVNYGTEMHHKIEDNRTTSPIYQIQTTGISGIVGINYEFKDKIVVGAELAPTLNYSNNESAGYSPIRGAIREQLGLDFNLKARLNFLFKF